MLIQVSTKAKTTAIEVSQFHQDVAKCALHGIKTALNVAAKMVALLTAQYGATTAPTFAQYKADLKALKAIAKKRGLESEQALVRPYGAALKTLYGSLPVSMDPAAVLKREQRAKADEQVKAALSAAGVKAAPVGAPKGETQERVPSEAEQLDQFIARIGVFETLYACLRILDTEPATHAQVVHLRKMADKAKDAATSADKAARVAKITPQQGLIESIAADLTAKA